MISGARSFGGLESSEQLAGTGIVSSRIAGRKMEI